MTNDWDGTERREAAMLVEQFARSRPTTVEAPVVMALVGFAAILLMQAVSLWGHGVMVQNQHRLIETDRQFACYVVHTSQGESPTTALTACGFINLGPPK